MKGKNYAKRQAEKLLSKYLGDIENIDINSDNDLPIDVNHIAKKLNIKVILYDFSDGVSGAFFKDHDNLILGVNKSHSKQRQRFTIAHEIAHYILHSTEYLHYDLKKQEEIFFRADNISNPDEVEANHFAAELLMPEILINKCIDNNILLIEDLAKLFNVSKDAMMYRLISLRIL